MATISAELSIRPSACVHYLKFAASSTAMPILYDHLMELRLVLRDKPSVAPMLWEDIKGSSLFHELFHRVKEGVPWDDPEGDPIITDLLLVHGCMLYLNTLSDFTIFGDLPREDDEFGQLVKETIPKVIRRLVIQGNLRRCTDPLCSTFFYWPILTFLGDYFPTAMEDGDQEFLAIVNPREVYRFMLELHFDPHCRILRIPTDYNVRTSRLYPILKSWEQLEPLLAAFDPVERAAHCLRACSPVIYAIQDFADSRSWIETTGREIVLKFGRDTVALRCCDLFHGVETGEMDFFHYLINLVLLVFCSMILQEAFLKARLHMAIVGSFWQAFKSNLDGDDFTTDVCTKATRLLSLMLSHGSSGSGITTDETNGPSHIQHFQDILFLMSRSIQMPVYEPVRDFGCEDLALYVQRFYRKHEMTDPSVCDVIVTTFIHVASTLRQLVRIRSASSTSNDHIQQLPSHWASLVDPIIPKRDLENLGNWEPKTYVPSNGLEKNGCSWVKCIRSSIQLRNGTLRCSQCKSAYYCSARCQQWDWKGGGHRENCIAHP